MTNKSLVTVVTANRFMAETIASAIGATNEHSGYYYGNGYAVTWTNGEIIEAEYKADEKFVMNSGQDIRQMYAHHFNFKMRNYDALLGWEKSKQDAAQLAIIEALWAKSSVIVNAMEPTLEGELAFLNLYWHLRMPVTVRRAWLPRLRKPLIIKAVERGTHSPDKHEKWLAEELINFFLKADAEAAENDLASKNPDEETTTEIVEDSRIDLNIVKGQPLHNMISLWVEANAELGYDFKLYYAPYRDDPEPMLCVNDKMKRWYDEGTDQMGNLRELATLTARGEHTKDITGYILKMMNENERAKEMLEAAKRPLEPSVISLDIKNIRLTDFMKALGYQYPMAADGNLRMYPAPYDNDPNPNLVINIQTNQWRDIKSGAYGGIYDLAYELTGSCSMSEFNHYIAGQMSGLKPEGLLLKKQEQPKVEPPKQEPEKSPRKMRM